MLIRRYYDISNQIPVPGTLICPYMATHTEYLVESGRAGVYYAFFVHELIIWMALCVLDLACLRCGSGPPGQSPRCVQTPVAVSHLGALVTLTDGVPSSPTLLLTVLVNIDTMGDSTDTEGPLPEIWS